MVRTDRITAGKRADRSAMVYGKRNQIQDKLLSLEKSSGAIPGFFSGNRAVECAAAE